MAHIQLPNKDADLTNVINLSDKEGLGHVLSFHYNVEDGFMTAGRMTKSIKNMVNYLRMPGFKEGWLMRNDPLRGKQMEVSNYDNYQASLAMFIADRILSDDSIVKAVQNMPRNPFITSYSEGEVKTGMIGGVRKQRIPNENDALYVFAMSKVTTAIYRNRIVENGVVMRPTEEVMEVIIEEIKSAICRLRYNKEVDVFYGTANNFGDDFQFECPKADPSKLVDHFGKRPHNSDVEGNLPQDEIDDLEAAIAASELPEERFQEDEVDSVDDVGTASSVDTEEPTKKEVEPTIGS